MTFDAYQTSSAQKRLFLVNQLYGDNTAYNISHAWIIDGNLHAKQLENAIIKLSKRHETLRTCFAMKEGQVLQKVFHNLDFQLEYIQLPHPDINRFTHDFIQPFNLEQPPLWRAKLVQLDPGHQLFLFDIHHTIADGSSMNVLIKDLMTFYSGQDLEPLEFQYVDFTMWQNDMLTSDLIKKQEKFWLDTFSSDLPLLDLPYDFPRNQTPAMSGDRFELLLDKEITAALFRLASEQKTTLFTTLLAMVNILLFHYSGQEDIIVGSPISGRTHREFENIIGMFVNTLALRNFPLAQIPVNSFIDSVSQNVFNAFNNQDYPFEMLVEKRAPQRHLNRNPLTDTFFVLQNFDHDFETSDPDHHHLKITPYHIKEITAKFDLLVQVYEMNNELLLRLEYPTALFLRPTIERMAYCFKNILKHVCRNRETLLKDINLLDEKEREHLLYDLNQTTANYPAKKTIIDLFHDAVTKWPNHTALAIHDSNNTNEKNQAKKEVSYQELNKKANQVAHNLNEHGITKESIVALLFQPSLEMLTAILGVLKAGGTYLPLDPEHPAARHLGILKDCAAQFLLSDQDKNDEPGPGNQWNGLWLGPNDLTGNKKHNDLPRTIDVAHTAYIIYTSGSTGKPKGVMIEHRQVVRLMFNDHHPFNFSHLDSWTLFHSYCFDFSVWEMYGALLYGGKLHIFPRHFSRDTQEFLHLLAEERVTILNQTPSAFYNLIEMEALRQEKEPGFIPLQVRTVIFGGEALTPARLARWQQWYPATILINMFGITETTVHVTFKEIGVEEINRGISNIGRPIPTLTTYVLDRFLKPVPLGVPGELFVGGAGVGRGYLNRPALTAERFIPNPFIPGDRLYRSGDRVRLTLSGDLEYLGRIDLQVQIKGYRVELGEIEKGLYAYPGVKTAVVTMKPGHQENQGELFLCGYIVPARENDAGQALAQTNPGEATARLKSFLSTFLPTYMIPTYLLLLDELPLTPNGKIDKQALPGPMDVETWTEIVPPRNAIETELTETWAEVLHIPVNHLGIDTGFFTVGGHSLNATILLARIHKTLDIKIPLAELFRHPTIRALSHYIENHTKTRHISIEPGEEKEYYPLSSAQQRLFLLSKIEENSTAYNMTSIFRLEGPLDIDSLQLAFLNLIRRHETLRTSFILLNSEPVQRVHPADSIPFSLQYDRLDSPGWARENLRQIQAIANKQLTRSFDLSQFPLLRVSLIQVSPLDHLLLFDLHHIVSDGTSMGILADDFIRYYEGEVLSPLPLQYHDYAAWQNQAFASTEVRNQEKYWLSQFPDPAAIPILDLVTDFTRPVLFNFAGDSYEARLNPGESALIRQLVSHDSTGSSTLFITLLTALNIFLYHYTGQEDIVIGTGVMGRNHADLQPIIGMFINTLALRHQPQKHLTVRQFLRKVKENTIKAFENQDIPFETLVDKINPPRDTSRNPLFDIMLVVQNFTTAKKTMRTLTVSAYPLEKKTAKFDLTFFVFEEGDEIVFIIEYCTSLYMLSTIQRWLGHFLSLLRLLPAHFDTRIEDIDWISPAEKQLLLEQWNDTTREFPADRSYPAIMTGQAGKTPDRVALIGPLWTGGHGHITYRQLEWQARTIGHYLRNLHHESILYRGEPVGVLLEPGVERVAAMLGIMKAGAAFVPLDPGLPVERLSIILADAAMRFVVSSQTFLPLLTILQKQCPSFHACLFLEELLDTPDHDETRTREDDWETHRVTDPAYIIYTSGSTGIPKGVIIEHLSLLNLCHWHNHYYQVSAHDRASQYAGFGFDASVWEVFPYLLQGAVIHMIDHDTRLDIHRLHDYLAIHSISIAFLPTQLCEQFIELQPGGLALRCLLTGGDKLERFHPVPYDLYNNYGPTENTVVTTSGLVKKPGGRIPIGQPITNTRVYILHPQTLRVQPLGVVGELCIQGTGLARGYLNRPLLTQEKFVVVEHVSFPDTAAPMPTSKRIYRSGDLARWRSDGYIQFMGRSDAQVKIRGFRIEPGEIEYWLNKHEQVKDALVVPIDQPGDVKFLCAYIRPVEFSQEKTTRLWAEEIFKPYLAGLLPAYMVPSAFIVLDEFPLAPSGKVNRQALPIPVEQEGKPAGTAPRDRLERKLALVWSEVLNLELTSVGIDDHFFELGGHSLKAMALLAKIHRDLEIKISLGFFFQHPHIRGLHDYIVKSGFSRYGAIEVAEKQEYYPLTSAQRRMFILSQMEDIGTTYNITQVLKLDGPIEVARFEQVFTTLVARHEVLRTSFYSLAEGTLPVQCVHDQVDFHVTYESLQGNQDRETLRFRIAHYVHPFTLSHPPLLHVALLAISPREHILVLDMHHIIADGTSFGILVKEFISLYSDQVLPPLKLQYRDFACWEQGKERQEKLEKQALYWLERLRGELPILFLPTDYPRPPVQRYQGEAVTMEMGPGETAGLKQLALNQEAGLFITLLTTLYVLLWKMSGQDDIILGTAVASRGNADLESMIGMFVNTLALRQYPDPQQPFLDFFQQVKEKTLQDLENQDYPFDELVERLAVPRDPGRNPLFDVMFSLQNMDIPVVNLPDLVLSPLDFENKTSKFDLDIDVIETSGTLTCHVEYNTGIFKRETVLCFLRYWQTVIAQVIQNPARACAGLDILSDLEKQEILAMSSAPAYPLEKNWRKNLVEFFENRVIQSPGQTLVVFNGQQLTYGETNERANCLARRLQEQGAGPGGIVVLFMDRSFHILTAVLAVLKSGAGFLPVDPSNPTQRVRHILKDSASSWILTYPHLLPLLPPDHNCQVFMADEEPGDVLNDKKDFPRVKPFLETSLAYIIYTSGSTGQPKGVMVSQESYLNAAYAWLKEYRLQEMEVNLLQVANFTFDVFAGDVARVLVAEGKMVICPANVRVDPVELYALIQAEAITFFESTPALVIPFCEYVYNNQLPLDSLELLIIGSDICPVEAFRSIVDHFGQSLRVINSYGVTEATIDTLYYEGTPGETVPWGRVPVGKPLPGMTVYVLNPAGLLQPVGVVGELCIGGQGVAWGYLNKVELTAQKFTADPFAPGRLIYRTGDLARWLPGFQLDFIGRLDYQVKIRGFRIEPGEIRSLILKHPGVSDAVITAYESSDGEKYLCAYIVPVAAEAGADFNLLVTGMKTYLARELPGYMVPAFFIPIVEIPLTANDKIDRKALPAPVLGQDESAIIAPRDQREKILAEIWAGVLGKPGELLGIDTNFFDIGGHSLKATLMLSRVHREWGVKIPMAELFISPTIRGLARLIETGERESLSVVEHVESREYYPLSPVQKRLYVLWEIDSDSEAYHITNTVKLSGDLDMERLTRAFRCLIVRHESFRTSFQTIGEEWVQRIHEAGPVVERFRVEYYPVERVDEIEPAVRRISRVFDLRYVPLLRVGVVHWGEKDYILVVNIHHIVADGYSMDRVTREFFDLYSGEELPPLKFQYKDYSQWINSEAGNKSMRMQEQFWLKELAGDCPVLNLPADFARPRHLSFAGDIIIFEIDESMGRALRMRAEQEQVTLFIFIAAVFYVLLQRLSGQEDILIGTATLGRRHPDLESIVGMFINTLVLRNYPRANMTFREFLVEAREHILLAFDNQDIQFDRLVEMTRSDRDPARNPIFDVTFEYQDFDTFDILVPGLNLEPYELDIKASKFDFSFMATQGNDRLVFSVPYNTSLFKASTMSLLVQYYQALLGSAIQNPGLKISQLVLVHERQREEVLAWLTSSFFATHDNHRELVFQERLQQCMEQYVDRVAIEYWDAFWTYGQIHHLADEMARKLRRCGPGFGSLIGIYTDNRVQLILAMVAILKLGGVFVPLDPVQPLNRLEIMVETIDLKWIIHDPQGKNVMAASEKCVEQGVNWIDMQDLVGGGVERGLSDGDSCSGYTPADPIYIYFTSGTTGQPKAILGQNRGLRHFIDWEIETFALRPGNRVSQLITPGFDAFLRDVFVAFVGGGTLCIPRDAEILASSDAFKEWLHSRHINLVHCVPSLFRLLITPALHPGLFPALKYILLSGEKMVRTDLEIWYQGMGERVQLVNLYGPTETTMVKTFYLLSPADLFKERIPVGKAMSGAQVLILDDTMTRVCDPLVTGEIYIRTPYRTHGYYRDPGQTQRVFLLNPFQAGAGLLEPPDLLFKTGDLGRYLADGNVEFLGRKDRQVKIRGIRVELEGIESQLQGHLYVQRAVVVKKELPGYNDILCAYITPADNPALPQSDDLLIEAVREYASERLPGYMVPSYFIKLETIPLLANGKVNWKALPDPWEESRKRRNRAVPRDQREDRLAGIWAQVLGVEKQGISMDAHFFHIGGQSLSATRMLTKVHSEFEVRIPLARLFTHPTIRGLAEYIAEAEKEALVPILPVEKRQYYPLSAAQQRLFVIQQMNPLSTAYHLPVVVALEGEWDVERIESVFRLLITRHESLRTSFHIIEDQPVQRVEEPEDISFSVKSVNGDGLGFMQVFDFSHAPLFRVGLRVEVSGKYVLFVDIHHIIADGMSLDILMQEFVRVYRGEELPALVVQYKDFSIWQEQDMNSELYRKRELYWLQQFRQGVPVLALPTDFPRDATSAFRFDGERCYFETGIWLAARLDEGVILAGVTMFQYLLAVYTLLLSRYSRQEDIVIGCPVSGRSHADLQSVVGMFVNMLPFRNGPQSNITFRQFLETVKNNAFAAYENQDFPFENLVARLGLQGETGRNPLFDAAFAFDARSQEHGDLLETDHLLKVEPVKFEAGKSIYDLILRAQEVPGNIGMAFEYKTALFRSTTIEKYSKRFLEILEQVLDNPDILLKDIEFSSDYIVVKPVEVEEEWDFRF